MSASRPPLARFARWLCIALVLGVAVPAAPGYLTVAHAQQSGERSSGGGILRFLFQRGDRQDRVVPKEAPRQQAPARRAQSPASRPAPPPTPTVEKAENARRVLVVGDFMASGLAEGLDAAFAEEANVVVLDRANGSSGLVRDDHYDWPANIGAVIDAEKPAVVVLMVGSNDRQQMLVGGSREQPFSETWIKEYERRATLLVSTVRAKSIPLIWVGNLPFRPGSMSSDMIALNDIYRRIVTDAGGDYVDVWGGFVDESGAFVANGPDINGQPAQLRASDGINVTRQGRRKIAFYVEKPLNRLLNIGKGEPGTLLPGSAILDGAPVEPGKPVIVDRTMPVAIDDFGIENGGLLGASVAPAHGKARTPAERLAREGIAPAAKPGRADDFQLHQPTPPDPETTTAVTP